MEEMTSSVETVTGRSHPTPAIRLSASSHSVAGFMSSNAEDR